MPSDSQAAGDAAFGDDSSSSSMGLTGSSGGGMFSDIMGFIGNMLAADARTKAAEYSWSLLDQNAALAASASANAIERGNIQAGIARMQGSQAVAQQSVAYAGGGVDENEGTPAVNAEATAAVAELDAQTAQNNAAREAWGFRTQETRFQNQKKQSMDAWNAQNTQYSLNQIGTIAKFGMDAAGSGMGG